MNRMVLQHLKQKNLVIISLAYTLFINVNNSIYLIQGLIGNLKHPANYTSFTQWFFGLIMVFAISWSTLSFNLFIKPHILPGIHKKHPLLHSLVGNVVLGGFLYTVILLLSHVVQLFSVVQDNLMPGVFGWVVVYAISLIIYSAIKYQRQSELEQKEKEVLKTEKYRSELNEIKSLINPHFLFNSLNTLNALIKIDPDKASTFTAHLSRLYRYILTSKDKDLMSVKEELYFIQDYVQLIKIRYDKNFNIEIDISEEQQKNEMPALALQLLIENAEKHNIISENTPLCVKIYMEGAYLVVSHKLQERLGTTNSIGNGLAGLSKRCELLLREELLITRSDCFTVKVPVQKPALSNASGAI